jgi:hypothetical protein
VLAGPLPAAPPRFGPRRPDRHALSSRQPGFHRGPLR